MPDSPSDDLFEAECPGREVLDHLTSRWGLLILLALRDGPQRFFELRNRIGGVSEKMLSQTLRTLEHDGLVSRAVEPSTPPKVSYALTRLGRSATIPLQRLVGWIRLHTDDVLTARRTRSRS